MKIVICCNHSYPHIGGSEKIIQQIAESMIKFGHECTILSFNVKEKICINGVNICPCPITPECFFEYVKNKDINCLFVYSDCFLHWPVIVDKAEKIPARKVIALVGMNKMLSNKSLFKKFRSKSSLFKIITHSDTYQDYVKCTEGGLDVNVVHNGIDLTEIESVKDINFRSKYGIKKKHMILCVSNFFPDKGQKDLVKMLNILAKDRNDFTAVFVSSAINYFPGKVLASELKGILKTSDFDSVFLTDIGRDNTLSAFKEADIFVFPSKKEVAPIVVLESMAFSLPWVSLAVGNITSLTGGIVVYFRGKDKFDNAKYDELIYNQFADSVNRLLESKSLRLDLGAAGKLKILNTYNWNIIAEEYNRIFTS